MNVRTVMWPSAAIVGVITFTAAAVHVGDEFRTALDANTKAITMLTEQMQSTWSREDHERWASILSSLNPELRLPPDPAKKH